MNPTRPAHPTDAVDPRSDPDAINPNPTTVATSGRRSTSPVGESEADITRAFSTSMVISGIRCLLAYIVFPWILPLLGVARGVGPTVGLVVALVAIGFNLASIRRFMRSGHRYRYWISTINVLVIGMLTVLVVRDVVDLVG